MYEFNIETAVTLPTPTRTGYTFSGWYTDAYFYGSPVNNNTEIPAGSSGNRVYYAKWEIINYIITYVDKDGENSGDYDGYTQSFNINSGWVSLYTPSALNGKIFANWYTNSSTTAGTEQYDFEAIDNLRDFTVYSKYATEYTITYNADGGTLPSGYRTSFTEYNEFDLPVPFKTGYDFAGWYYNSSFTGESVTSIELGTNWNPVFYAKWELHNYTVTYYVSDKGYLETYEQSFTIETSDIYLPEPSSTYTFAGWFTTSDFQSGTEISVISCSYTFDDVEVWASWYVNDYVYWENISNETPYCFTQSGYTWSSNNQQQDSTTATSTFVITLFSDAYVEIPYTCSSESIDYDYINLTLDEVQVAKAGGISTTDYVYSQYLSAGSHTLVVSYRKDITVSLGTDTATVTLNPINTVIRAY